MNIIYHNPNWSKSRKSVEILEKSNLDFKIIKYLKNPPNESEIKNLCTMLNCEPIDIIRKNEKDFKNNNLDKIADNRDLIIKKMVKYPKIIERPIIIIKNKAVIGRPPENIYEILEDWQKQWGANRH